MLSAPFSMEPMLGFCWIGFFLIVGMILRAKIPFCRKYLIPSCLLGGIVGFGANASGLIGMTGLTVSDKTFQTIIYHIFNLTWIYIGLQRPMACTKGVGALKKTVRTQMWTGSGAVFVGSAAYGCCVLAGILLQYFGATEPASLGILTATGFTAGPGQAMTRGAIWEAQGGLSGAAGFALGGASTGFAVAMVVGIPLMNLLARRKKLTVLTNPSEAERVGFFAEDQGPVAGRQTTTTSSIETFSWHIALGFFSYMLLILVYYIAEQFLAPKPMAVLWGLLFVMALSSGIFVRKVMDRMGIAHLCCRNVTNRVSGLLVDFLACGTFITIQVGAVNKFLSFYLLTCLVATVVIGGLSWWICSRVRDHGAERFGIMFGTLTGTVSTGLVLTRMIDPENKSPAAVDWGAGALYTFPFLIAVGSIIHTEVLFGRSPWILVAFFAATGLSALGGLLFFRQDMYKPGEVQDGTSPADVAKAAADLADEAACVGYDMPGYDIPEDMPVYDMPSSGQLAPIKAK